MLQNDVTVLVSGNQNYGLLNWAYNYYSNVYGKISYAPLNILASVCQTVKIFSFNSFLKGDPYLVECDLFENTTPSH